ncbi:MAG: serine hydrolase domain-containing protein, partial [Pseudomonadales bacterium]
MKLRFLSVLLVVFAMGFHANAWAGKPLHAGGPKTSSTGSGGSTTSLQLSFQASATQVDYGQSVDLYWASMESQSCDASGDWSGRKDITGSETIRSITADSSFTLTCKLKKYSVAQTVRVAVNPDSAPAPAPSVNLTSSATTVDMDGTATLSWNASNATVCHASGAWSGDLGVSGSKLVGPISTKSTYSLTCDGDGGSASDSVVVDVLAPAPDPKPTVTLSASDTVVPYDGSSTLTWSSQDASRCYAGGAWSGDLSFQGSQVVGPLTASNTYSVTCDNASGSSYAAVSIQIQDSTPVDVSSPGYIGDGRLDAIVQSIRDDYGLPGLAVVITRNGQVAEASAAGVRVLGGKDAVTLQDQWHLGSLSKAVTGTLIGIFVEKGVLSWNTRVKDVWPGMSMQAQYANATLADLLSHASGLPSNVWSVPSMSSGKLSDGNSYSLPERRMFWTQDLLAIAPEASLGSFHYSNGGYIVAAAMLETLTGDSWENLVKRYVLDPLGMAGTGFGAPQGNEPWGHKDSGGSLVPVDPTSSGADNVLAMAPAGGIHTTLN